MRDALRSRIIPPAQAAADSLEGMTAQGASHSSIGAVPAPHIAHRRMAVADVGCVSAPNTLHGSGIRTDNELVSAHIQPLCRERKERQIVAIPLCGFRKMLKK